MNNFECFSDTGIPRYSRYSIFAISIFRDRTFLYLTSIFANLFSIFRDFLLFSINFFDFLKHFCCKIDFLRIKSYFKLFLQQFILPNIILLWLNWWSFDQNHQFPTFIIKFNIRDFSIFAMVFGDELIANIEVYLYLVYSTKLIFWKWNLAI